MSTSAPVQHLQHLISTYSTYSAPSSRIKCWEPALTPLVIFLDNRKYYCIYFSSITNVLIVLDLHHLLILHMVLLMNHIKIKINHLLIVLLNLPRRNPIDLFRMKKPKNFMINHPQMTLGFGHRKIIHFVICLLKMFELKSKMI
jgi:hypothetical protein